MEKVEWNVEGMTCSNCALSINKVLQKKGMKDIMVNPIDGSVSFTNTESNNLDSIKAEITELGYRVVGRNQEQQTDKKKKGISTNKQRFLLTLPFTLTLMLHMLHPWVPVHFIMNGWVQLFLCLPVFIIGMLYFGRSAWKSILSGVPNMNVLVTLSAACSFLYSLAGMFWFHDNQYLFFETTATIITLVFLGNYLEESTIKSTQKALKSLEKVEKVMANMIAFDDKHQEQVFEIENTQLKTGDLVLIRTGEQVPVDCKIIWGDCQVNEAIITGESLPQARSKKDFLIGGSVLESGNVKAQVTATGKETVLSGIIDMVRRAQLEKPPMQKLADRISAIFVPTVTVIALLTFAGNIYFFHTPADQSLMRAIAVLVIACPCAMGLATPAAIAVGMGRSARNGIVFRNASTLESFRKIKQVVFDKTGTLTTGNFRISSFHTDIEEDTFKSIVYSLEKFSGHPIANCIVSEWNNATLIRWKKAEEIKGVGIRAEDESGNIYEAGSSRILADTEEKSTHNVYVKKNNKLIGWIDVMDEIRPEAKEVIEWFNSKGIKTIMLTGDMKHKAEQIATPVGMSMVYAEKSPAEKMEIISALNAESPTAMVGDGINDAPALAKATIGISIGKASQLAVQNADVILMSGGLKNLPLAMGLGKHTFITIRRNLFWAFSYNIIAIPVAAAGLLSPSFSAFTMGFSDLMLAFISLHLFIKKVV